MEKQDNDVCVCYTLKSLISTKDDWFCSRYPHIVASGEMDCYEKLRKMEYSGDIARVYREEKLNAEF